MDLICSKCGEPWEVGHVLHEEPERFNREGSLILGCPCCDANLEYQSENLSEPEKEQLSFRLSCVREVCELLGDDVDGAASYLRDFSLL